MSWGIVDKVYVLNSVEDLQNSRAWDDITNKLEHYHRIELKLDKATNSSVNIYGNNKYMATLNSHGNCDVYLGDIIKLGINKYKSVNDEFIILFKINGHYVIMPRCHNHLGKVVAYTTDFVNGSFIFDIGDNIDQLYEMTMKAVKS